MKKDIMQFFLITYIGTKKKYLAIATKLASNNKYAILYCDDIEDATPLDSSEEARDTIPTLHNPHQRSITVESILIPVVHKKKMKQSQSDPVLR